jgi:hypothetical protein
VSQSFSKKHNDSKQTLIDKSHTQEQAVRSTYRSTLMGSFGQWLFAAVIAGFRVYTITVWSLSKLLRVSRSLGLLRTYQRGIGLPLVLLGALWSRLAVN